MNAPVLAKVATPPRPSPAANQSRAGRCSIAPWALQVITSPAACEPYGTDDSDVHGPTPDAVVLAENRDDIARTLEVAQLTGVPVTPRLAGSGRTGGAVPLAGGIVLVTLGMSSIKEIDRAERLAVVEPGVITGDLHEAVEREGLFYPPDPNSLKMCSMAATSPKTRGARAHSNTA